MADIKPFAALRPKPDLAEQICAPPYDVLSSEEARDQAKDNPLSFLHVSKPEIDLPPETDPYSEDVYAKGAENLRGLIEQGALFQDDQPKFYLYRQTMGDHVQTGLVAAASCEDYRKNVIKKHEFTRPDKEEDRVRHMEALNAQTGPVFLVYPAAARMNDLIQKACAEPPVVQFKAADGVDHAAWILDDPKTIQDVENHFAGTPKLYIADGHHRSAAAVRVYEKRGGAGQSAHFLSVLFPHDQMRILPYNRLVKDLNGLSADEFLNRLAEIGTIADNGAAVPEAKHTVSVYLNRQWRQLVFDPKLASAEDPVQRLDVSLLQNNVLAPVLDVQDPRTSKRVEFVGGIRGTQELERRVDSGEFAVAFSMYPTTIEDLMAISDADGVMPPKSTWFEPKLRDAMFSHLL